MVFLNKLKLFFKTCVLKDLDSIGSKIIFDLTIFYLLIDILFLSLFSSYYLLVKNVSLEVVYDFLWKLIFFSLSFLIVLRIILIHIIKYHLIDRFEIFKNELFKMIEGSSDHRLTLFGSDEIDKLAFYTNNIFDKFDHLLSLEKKNSLIDPLTSTFNRRALNLNFSSELQKALRKNKTLSLVMFDIDNFKKVNDIYGHDVGDEVLVKMSQIIKLIIRSYDGLYRVGGEEFLILMFDLKIKEIKHFLNRLQKEITYKLKKSIPKIEQSITVSGGFVISKNYKIKEISSDLLLNKMLKDCDKLLYKAKQNGKNKILIEI